MNLRYAKIKVKPKDTHQLFYKESVLRFKQPEFAGRISHATHKTENEKGVH